MNQSEKHRFSELMTDVMAYYGKDTSDFMLSLWWDACANFSFEQVSKALNAHAKDAERGVYAPKVADIVRQLEGTSTDRAGIAWGKVLGAISAVGAYQDVVFDDPAIHAAIVDCGGWTKVCRGELAELSYLQHRFCQAHKTYTERREFEYPKQLSGDRSPDSEYLKYGRPLPRPALVGDIEKAKRVLMEGGEGGPKIAFNVSEQALMLIDARVNPNTQSSPLKVQ
jgi:hypothetical protein